MLAYLLFGRGNAGLDGYNRGGALLGAPAAADAESFVHHSQAAVPYGDGSAWAYIHAAPAGDAQRFVYYRVTRR